MFVESGTDAVRKKLFFCFFCWICWVCCDCPQNWWFSWCWSINAVVEFKREVSSSFSKTTQGVCAPLAPYTIKLSLFQQIQGHIPHHLKISFSQHMVDFFQSAIKFKVEYFVSWVSLKKKKKSKGGWCSGLKRERKISLYVAKSGLLSSSSASSMLPFNGLSCVLPYSLIYIHRSGKRLNNNSPFQTYKKENGNVTKKP